MVPNCCRKFEYGAGFGYSFGFTYNLPVSYYFLFNFRAEFISAGGELTANEYEQIFIDGEKAWGEIEHRIDATLKLGGLGAFLAWRPDYNLSIFAGISANYLLVHKFSQIEEIIKPDDRGTFENNLRERNKMSGEIDSISKFLYFISLGVSYDLPLNNKKTLLLSPELFFSYSINSVLNDYSWSVSRFSIGFSFKYRRDIRETTPIGPMEN
jgi:hypothetical protein